MGPRRLDAAPHHHPESTARLASYPAVLTAREASPLPFVRPRRGTRGCRPGRATRCGSRLPARPVALSRVGRRRTDGHRSGDARPRGAIAQSRVRLSLTPRLLGPRVTAGRARGWVTIMASEVPRPARPAGARFRTRTAMNHARPRGRRGRGPPGRSARRVGADQITVIPDT